MSRRYKRMREIYEFQIDRSLPIEGGEDLREESREKIDGNQREREKERRIKQTFGKRETKKKKAMEVKDKSLDKSRYLQGMEFNNLT